MVANVISPVAKIVLQTPDLGCSCLCNPCEISIQPTREAVSVALEPRDVIQKKFSFRRKVLCIQPAAVP